MPGEDRRLRTRWTLGFTFKLLPWRPEVLFTGVSDYTIDGDALVVGQRDCWDTLSLGSGGAYVPDEGLAGVSDLVSQMLPGPLRPVEEYAAAGAGDWGLLRRAAAYRVYREASGGRRVFAVPSPGAGGAASLEALWAILREHGLTAGAELAVQTSGRGQVSPPAGARLPEDAVAGLEVLSPHPWEGEPPPE